MKNVRIKSRIVDNFGETTITDVDGTWNKDENLILYIDKNVNVCVIIGEKISIERICDDYKLVLKFDKSNETVSVYDIYKPAKQFKITINTNILEIKNNGLYIEYELKIEEEKIGKFIFDINWEE